VPEDYLRGLQDPEVQRLTGTHAAVDRAAVEDWLRTRADQNDRADWAVLRAHDGGFLSESVLNNLDADNGSASFWVWLAGLEVFGRGYGTEGTRLVVDYAFDVAGLHRLALRSMSTTRVRAGCRRSAGSPSKGGGERPCCGGGAATTPS